MKILTKIKGLGRKLLVHDFSLRAKPDLRRNGHQIRTAELQPSHPIQYCIPELYRSEPHQPENETAARLSSFERFPVEILISIMQCLYDLPTLKALNRASPTFYRIYCNYQNQILYSVFQNASTTEILYEAKSLYLASLIPTKNEQRVENVKIFLIQYAEGRDKPLHLEAVDSAALVYIERIESLIDTLTDQYFESAQNTICCLQRQHPYASSTIYDPGSISVYERRRIKLAFYHYELLCILFAPHTAHVCTYPSQPKGFTALEISTIYLSQFWNFEVEELGCIRDWLNARWNDVIAECRAGLHTLRATDGQNTASEMDMWRSLWERNAEDENESLLALGLGFFREVWTEKDFEMKVWLLRDNCWILKEFMSKALYEDRSRRFERFRFTRRARNFYFFRTDEKGPNKGWECAQPFWDRNLGEVVDVWFLRFWGYVFWDAERLRQMGVLEWRDPDALSARYQAFAERSKNWRGPGRWIWQE
ncbi:hypothetical protein BGZ60DRAFT_395801 [Tricladium varicosporioides]|nr:hypothetical protein BGZ60DRAFT_395801 [Hymenoscyphus varicosporioides]